MGWWSKIFGGGVVETVGKTIDNVHYSGQEQAADDLADTNAARAFAAPGSGGQGYFNDLVDAFNRLIRPGLTVWLMGGFVGWWPLPRPDMIDPFWLQIFLVVVTFWFGGRVLLKDLPAMIKAIMAFRSIKRR